MGKLIRFEFRKLLKSKYVYIILGISLIFVIINGLTQNLAADIAKAYTGEGIQVSSYTFVRSTLSSIFSLLAGILIAIYVCEDFSQGVLKNIVGKGYAREKVLYSKYIVSLVATLVLALLTVLMAIIYGNIAWPGTANTSDNLGLIILGQLVGVITYHALFFALAYTIRKSGFAIAINVVTPLVMTLLLTLIDTGLQNAKLEIRIAPYWLDNLFSVFTGTGNNTDIFGRNIAILVIYFIAAFVAGLLINRKREIKQ